MSIIRKKARKTKQQVTSVKPARNIVAALDVGSSKISCFIAEVKGQGSIEVLGIGHQASRGVKSGTIIDLRAAETAISHAVEAAEVMARGHLQGHPIRSVFVNVPGNHTLSHPLKTDIALAGQEVTDRDVRAALSHARTVEVAGRDQLIHTVVSGFSIDGQRGIEEPRGMSGASMRVGFCAVTALSPALRNLSAVVGQNHLEIDGYVAEPYAAGLACLTPDEMNLGCTVVDMGGGTTSIAVFQEGKLIYTSAVPVGGNHVTSDVALGLTTSLADAERIKNLYGSAQATGFDDGDFIDVPPLGEEEHINPNHVSRSLLIGIIQPRIEETFELVRAKLVDSGINSVAGRRVVLTGGASQLPGLTDLAQLILGKQVRLGRPSARIRGLAEATAGPAFSTTAGLLLYAADHLNEVPMRESDSFAPGLPFALPVNFPLGSGFLQKVTHWLKENW